MHGVSLGVLGGKVPILVHKWWMTSLPGFIVCDDRFWFVSQMEQSVTKSPELESPSNSSLKIRMETCHACSVEELPKGPDAEREKEEKEKHLSPEPLPSPGQAEVTEGTSRDASAGGSSCQEFLRLSPGKEVMKEMSRVKREVCLTLVSLPMEGRRLYLAPLSFITSRSSSSAGSSVCLPVLCVRVCTHVLIAALGAAQFVSCRALAVSVLEKSKMLLYC